MLNVPKELHVNAEYYIMGVGQEYCEINHVKWEVKALLDIKLLHWDKSEWNTVQKPPLISPTSIHSFQHPAQKSTQPT